MAPGAKKNPKAKSKKALSVDFKRVKTKVGRKLAPPRTASKVEFKSKGIVIRGQSLAQDKDGLSVNLRKQTLKELLVQSTHYRERMRRDALMGLKDLFGKFPKELIVHAVAVIEKLCPRITDAEKSVRQALVLLLQSSILPQLPQIMMKPLVPMIMAHVSTAMTHLVPEIRLSACTFSDLLVQHCPALVVPTFSDQIVQHYVGLLKKGGISGLSGRNLSGVLTSLEHYLSALRLSKATHLLVGSLASSVTHTWGQKWTSNQGEPERIRGLHAYKSELPDGKEIQPSRQHLQLMSQTERLHQLFHASTELVSVLLECWAEHAPMVCSAPNPDVTSLDCMVLVTKCLCHIFQTLTREAAAGSLARDISKNTAAIYLPEPASEEWEFRMLMQSEFYPDLHRHLLRVFPMPAPVVQLPPKVEEALVALNVGICETMLQFFLPQVGETEFRQNDELLRYFEGALYGVMLPSSEFSEGVSKPKLAALHVKSLIQYLPGLVMCVPSNWIRTLLQAFTFVFESSHSCSTTKMACLSIMTQLVLPGNESLERNNVKQISTEFQTKWLQSLPKLLWVSKHSNSNLSQAILEMLMYIGRSSVEGSALAESFCGLQHAMVPFFSSFLPSKQHSELRCVYGPFIKLPKQCQVLATDLTHYFSIISIPLLKALAQCVLCPDLDTTASVRIVEVLCGAFGRGAVGITEYLSFLFSLVASQASSQVGCSRKESMIEMEWTALYNDEAVLKKHSAIIGVVCASLSKVGDQHLVLSLLGPSIREELEKCPQLSVRYGLLRVTAFLSQNSRHSRGLYFPDSLEEVVPKHVADFLATLAAKKDGIGELQKKPVLNTLERPCMRLMARSSSFTLAVLKVIHESIRTVTGTSTKDAKQSIIFIQVMLELIKSEKLDHALLSSRDMINSIMKAVKDPDTQTTEGRELKRLVNQLQTASNALGGQAS